MRESPLLSTCYFHHILTDSSRQRLPLAQITKNGITTEGRLAYNLTEGPSANPRWLVKFDLQPWKDEELYERSFGALMRKAGNDEDRASPENYPNKRNSKSSNTSSDEDSKGKRKNVTFSGSSPVASDSSSINTNDAASKKAKAREQRIARRQAKIEEEDSQSIKRRVDRTASSNKRSRVDDSEEEVIKVPMLTGTLYLYRGLNRRAEFVRKC